MQSGSRSFGSKAALAAFLAGVAYAIPQVLQVLGWLADPWDRISIFAPSLLLAPSFVCAMAAAVDLAEPARRAQARAALGIAVMYATLVSTVYIVQLTVVIPGELNGEGATVSMLTCCAQHKPLTGMDLLGYSLMSVSLWLLAAALTRAAGRALYWVLVANGWLVFALVGQLAWPSLIYVGALWLVTFPAGMWLLRRRFNEGAPLTGQ